MSVINWPGLSVASFRWRKANQAVTFRSIFGSQSLEAASPLWEVEMTGAAVSRAAAVSVQAFLESLEGYQHQLSLWNLAQPVPLGTMRGTLTLAADAAQGATSLSITGGSGQAGKTLLKGDLIGIGSGSTQQVIRVAADATADGSGVIAVALQTALRNAFLSGASVTWDKPKALFRQKTMADGLLHTPDGAAPWSLTLIEDWRP